jgi:two-component system, NarL family, sensor histidine kinase DesK
MYARAPARTAPRPPLLAGIVRLHHWLLPQDRGLGWLPYLWLPYVGFLFVPWFYGTQGWYVTAMTAAAAALFFVLYFRGYRSCGPRNVGFSVACLTALALGLLPMNPGATVFAIYAAAFVGYLGSTRRSLITLALVVGLPTTESLLLGFSFWSWFPAVFFGTILGISNTYFGELRSKNRALARSQEEIEQLAARAERERIARDLHDLLGHTLSVIALKAELAGKLVVRDVAGASTEVRDVERIARNALAEVRAAVHGYRAGSFSGELANARVACAAAGIELETDIGCECSPAQTAVLVPVLREAMTNVIRHARARRLAISLSRVRGGVRLAVCDDGRGGDVHEGHGIAGMRERLLAAGGRLLLESTPAGLSLFADLPERQGERPASGEAAA